MSARLPKLIKLQLTVGADMLDLMGTLVNSCPSLQHLDLVFVPFESDRSFEIVGPNLLYLHTYVDCGVYPKIVIDAPKLEHVFVECDPAYYVFVNPPTALVTVHISLSQTSHAGGLVDFHVMMRSILRGISCARTLVLSDHTLDVLGSLRYAHGAVDDIPVFQNLLNLQLNKPLTEGTICWMSPMLGWLLSTVGMIRMYVVLEDDNNYLKFLEYVLGHAVVLKDLVFSILGHDTSEEYVLEEYKFCKALFTLPRSSSSCEIHFLGACVTAHSSGFKNGSLVCEIKSSD